MRQDTATPNTDTFLEAYWKVPEPVLNFAANPTNIEFQRQYGRFMLSKYGRAYIDYTHLIRETRLTGEVDEYYATGIATDFPPHSIMRSRNTLRALLNFMKSVEEQFTVADLGSGDGRIALGLALYLENLRRVYAIDTCPSAALCLERHVKSLSRDEQESVRNRIIPITGDYYSEQVLSELFREEKRGVDFSLAAYPLSMGFQPDKILPLLARTTKRRGSALLCIDWKEDKEDDADVNSIDTELFDTELFAGLQQQPLDDILDLLAEHFSEMSYRLIDQFKVSEEDGVSKIYIGRRTPLLSKLFSRFMIYFMG